MHRFPQGSADRSLDGYPMLASIHDAQAKRETDRLEGFAAVHGGRPTMQLGATRGHPMVTWIDEP